jgi:hypothetical protein
MSTRPSLTFPRHGVVGVAASVALLIGLAGCSTPSPPPSGSATPSVSPTPGAAAPRSIFPVGCEQVLKTSAAQSAIASTVSLRVDEGTMPTSLLEAAYRQTGGLDCDWTASSANSDGRADGVYLVALPDSLDALKEYQKVSSVDGSAQCVPSASGGTCGADFAVGTSWVSLSASDGGTAPTAQALASLMSKVTTSLTAATPTHDAWSPPSGSFSGSYFCDRTAAVAAHLQTVVGSAPDLSAGGRGGGPGTDATAFQKTGVAFCSWLFSKAATDDVELDVTTLPGGAWSIAGLNEWQVRPGGDMAVASVSVAGADAARAGCATYGCSGYLSYHHSLISVGLNVPMSVSDFTTLLGRLLAGVS